MMMPHSWIPLSGERFRVHYQIQGNRSEAVTIARTLCYEQTVEFPEALVPEAIGAEVVGRIEEMTEVEPLSFRFVISYAVETTAWELPQLLNVVFGNSSMKPGIRVAHLELTPSLYRAFPGPRFGRSGLRRVLGVPKRPLLCTALKPMGLSAVELGEMAYRFAVGGIDIIKDDHGLSNQAFAPLAERTKYCAAAVRRANAETGRSCIYVPNITAPYDKLLSNALAAKEAGAGGLLISPGLTGWDIVRLMAADDRIDMPLLVHPALQGSFVLDSRQGISHRVLFGQLARIAGADVTIFPNFGGRFSFSREECREISAGTEEAMGPLLPIFPAPGGGMSLEKIPDMIEVYGREVLFLIGGGLHQRSPDLIDNCRYFLKMVTELS